jgi:hypothetical protein
VAVRKHVLWQSSFLNTETFFLPAQRADARAELEPTRERLVVHVNTFSPHSGMRTHGRLDDLLAHIVERALDPELHNTPGQTSPTRRHVRAVGGAGIGVLPVGVGTNLSQRLRQDLVTKHAVHSSPFCPADGPCILYLRVSSSHASLSFTKALKGRIRAILFAFFSIPVHSIIRTPRCHATKRSTVARDMAHATHAPLLTSGKTVDKTDMVMHKAGVFPAHRVSVHPSRGDRVR